VRARLVVVVAESVEERLLLAKAVLGRNGRVSLQSSVHPLVSPVLLGMPWLDPLQCDPESDETNGEAGQTASLAPCERRTVIGSKCSRKTVLAENGFQHWPDDHAAHAGHVADRQDVPAEPIYHGERLASGAITGSKPTLEVARPDCVRRISVAQWLSVWRAPVAAAPWVHQPVSSQQQPDGARRWPSNGWRDRLQAGFELTCARGRAFPTEIHDLALDLEWSLRPLCQPRT
jgi:hypothetical protein